MTQLHFHKNDSIKAPPQRSNIPIIQHLIKVYKLWHEFLPHVPKTSRYTLGAKIDVLFADTIESIFLASYAPKTQKNALIQRAITKLDLLKFFLQILWEIKSLDNKKYIALSEPLQEVGRMLGGWNRQLTLTKETPA